VNITKKKPEQDFEGRDKYFVDIDRMVNEGLAGGNVSPDNGLVDETRPLSEEANHPKTQEKER
jgi:nitrogen fixation protein